MIPSNATEPCNVSVIEEDDVQKRIQSISYLFIIDQRKQDGCGGQKRTLLRNDISLVFTRTKGKALRQTCGVQQKLLVTDISGGARCIPGYASEYP
jgi:hypothetical protein